MIEGRKLTGKDKSHLNNQQNNSQHLHDRKPTTNIKRDTKNIYLRLLFIACLLRTWQGRGWDKLSRAHYEFTVAKSQRKPKKIKYKKCATPNWCFCRPRRSHDGVMQPWKANQISNAHASYGKTTSGRPSSSLTSWILRSLIRLQDGTR